MANSVTIKVNSSQVTARVSVFLRKGLAAAFQAEEAVGDEIIRLATAEVPLDEGTLMNSGAVDVQGNHHVAGYHTPYAARLHEHPEYRFRRGRKGKYLTDPVLNNKSVLGMVFGDSMKGGLQ